MIKKIIDGRIPVGVDDDSLMSALSERPLSVETASELASYINNQTLQNVTLFSVRLHLD